MRPGEEETLVEAALRVLNTPDPFDKARVGESVATRWLRGAIPRSYDPSVDLPVPDRPARLADVVALNFCSLRPPEALFLFFFPFFFWALRDIR